MAQGIKGGDRVGKGTEWLYRLGSSWEKAGAWSRLPMASEQGLCQGGGRSIATAVLPPLTQGPLWNRKAGAQATSLCPAVALLSLG